VSARGLRAGWQLVGLATLAAGVAFVLAYGLGLEDAVVVALLNTIGVVGLYVFVGNSGILSFGHIAFMAIGAYGSALLTIPVLTKQLLLPDLPGLLAGAHMGTLSATLIVSCFVGLLAYAVAVPLMRLSGIAAAIATLALLEIVRVVLVEWRAVSAGTGTLTGVPVDTGVGAGVLWLLIALTVAFGFQRSRYGLRLRAAREDEVAARASGIAVQPERRLAFALSAAVVAVAGSLYAHFIGVLSPEAFTLLLTFQTIAMLVIGGMYSLAGAVVGAFTISALYEIFTRLEAGDHLGPLAVSIPAGLREVLVALLMLAILARRPEGLTGGRELALPRRLRAATIAKADGPQGDSATTTKVREPA
jgi:branched-chain amino acid transport system permease protein